MANVRIEVDIEGTRALMRSPEIIAVLEKEARRRTEATGMEYRPDVYPDGRTRANAAGYQEPKRGQKKGVKYPVCPKCGQAHPNCNCYKSRG